MSHRGLVPGPGCHFWGLASRSKVGVSGVDSRSWTLGVDSGFWVSVLGPGSRCCDQVLKVPCLCLLGSSCSLQVQSLNSTTHLVRVLKVGSPLPVPADFLFASSLLLIGCLSCLLIG